MDGRRRALGLLGAGDQDNRREGVGAALPGRVWTASVATARHVTADEFWLITRAGPDIPGMIRCRDLAPREDLFDRYLSEWKGRPASEWWPLYVARFAADLQREPARGALRRLFRLVQAGRTVCLVCFCRDGQHCHRRLVASFLERYGVPCQEAARPGDGQLRFEL